MAWRGLMAFAVRRGFRETMPTDGLLPEERPKPGSATLRYLSREEIERMLAAARDEDDRDLIAVGVFTGMRASEILGVQLGELDFATEQIHVRWQMSRKGKRVPLKTNAGARDIVLIPALAKILRRRRLRLKRSSDNDLLFQSSTGRTMNYWVLQERFERMTKQAELKALTPHTMRHTFAGDPHIRRPKHRVRQGPARARPHLDDARHVLAPVRRGASRAGGTRRAGGQLRGDARVAL